MPPNDVSQATCDARYDAIKAEVHDIKGEIKRLWEKYETFSERAPKWCVVVIGGLSGMLGSSVTLICVFIKVILS